MKNVYSILFVLILSFGAQAQQKCSTAMNDFQFNRWYSQLSNIGNEQVKLNRTKIYNQSNCFSAEQIKKVATTFTTDDARLAYAENAYYSCVNREDYFEVLDAFTSFSSAFRLYDFMVANREGNNQNTTQEPAIDFPNLDYPRLTSNQSNTACTNPLSQSGFTTIALQVFQHQAPIKKYVVALQSLRGQCYTVEQAMKIATLLDNDNHKMDYLQKAYHHIYNRKDLGYGRQVFRMGSYKTGFDEFIKEKNLEVYGSNSDDQNDDDTNQDDQNQNSNNSSNNDCAVNENNFLILLSMVENEPSDRTRLQILKSRMANDDCYTLDQIRKLMKKLVSESLRMDFVKIAFDSCSQQNQYFQLTSEFISRSRKNELLKFIEEENK